MSISLLELDSEPAETKSISLEGDEELIESFAALLENLDQFPILEELQVYFECFVDFDELKAEPLALLFSRLKKLTLSGFECLDDVVPDWSSRGLFNSVEALELSDAEGMGESTVIEFMENGPYANLHELKVHAKKLGKGFVEAFIETEAFPNLQSLDLTNNKSLGATGVKALVRASVFDRLLSLRLSGVKAGAGVVVLLQRSWPRLQSLDLSYNSAKPKDWAAAFDGASFPELRSLNLSAGANPGDEIQGSIFETTQLPALEFLDVHNTLSVEAGKSLFTANYLPKLKTLTIGTKNDPVNDSETMRVVR